LGGVPLGEIGERAKRMQIIGLNFLQLVFHYRDVVVTAGWLIVALVPALLGVIRR
jgi:hypothetical protein